MAGFNNDRQYGKVFLCKCGREYVKKSRMQKGCPECKKERQDVCKREYNNRSRASVRL